MPVARKLALLARPALVALPKKLFVWSDWSAIEARITPWLAASPGAEKVLDIFRANDADPTRPDIYTIAAADVLHKDPSAVTKTERGIGKVSTLALGFGGSVGALQRMALNYRIHLDDAEARRIVDAWREANPWAREFWGAHRDGESFGLWGAAMRAWEIPGQITTAGRIAFVYREDYLGGALFMALPSGRLLTYPRPRWRDVDILDRGGKPTGEKRSELSFRRAHGRAKLWHGTFCENATQAVAADLLRLTVTRIETNPALAFMPIRMTTHDEIVCEVDEARAEEAKAILRREMLTLPDWAAGLPLHRRRPSAGTTQNLKLRFQGVRNCTLKHDRAGADRRQSKRRTEMKIFAEICVLKPEDTIKVVETLIEDNCSVVIRGNAYDQCNPTIFVVGYGEADIDDDGYNVLDHFESMLDETGGDVTESGEGHQDTMGEVVPPIGLQFAIDVFDDQSGITHRISCAEYSPELAYKMAIEAAGLLSNVRPRSLGNALARRMLLAALGGSVGVGSEADDELKELLKKEAAA